ncbi:MAG: hypothetical protein R3Y64_10715, partial [Peptostreptococcaceae bacterium]
AYGIGTIILKAKNKPFKITKIESDFNVQIVENTDDLFILDNLLYSKAKGLSEVEFNGRLYGIEIEDGAFYNVQNILVK